MKKTLITFSFISLMVNPAFANDNNKTIVINLDNVSNEIVSKIKSDSDKIMSKVDLTHLVAFVRNWKDKDLRKKELVTLYSSVIPQAFQKYPNSKEFHLSGFVNTKNRDLNKSEVKNISKIVVTKDELNKINWKSVNITNIKDNKHIKEVNFID